MTPEKRKQIRSRIAAIKREFRSSARIFGFMTKKQTERLEKMADEMEALVKSLKTAGGETR